MQKLRVRIVGTSNGVLSNGYAGYLRQMSDVDVVQNLSIGSSHSSLLPGVIEQFDDQRADICILDLAVNEQRALSRGLYNFATTEGLFDYFLRVCEEHRMLPIVLLLPLLAGPNPSKEAVNRWAELCIDRGVPFVDALEVAATEWPDIEARSLWRDPAHPDVALSERLAVEIYRRGTASLSVGAWPRPRRHRKFICYRDLCGDQSVRSTRIISKNFFALKEGDHQVIDVGMPVRIIGLGLNMAKSNAALEMTGDNRLLKSLANAFYESRDLWFVYWNLVAPVSSKSGTFELRVLRVDDNLTFEDNDHRPRELLPSHEPIQLEIESLILEIT